MTFFRQTKRLLICTMLVGVVLASRTQAVETADAELENSDAVEIFDAIDQGLVDVKFVARDSTKGRLVITNKTQEEVNVFVPEAFAGVPVLRQFGGGGGGGIGGGGGGGGQQSGRRRGRRSWRRRGWSWWFQHCPRKN